MSLAMTVQEREAYLADVHVAIMSVADDSGRAPLAVPVWYDYEPGGDVLIWIQRDTIKDKLIRAAGTFSFAVHTETPPYKYVTVEGPVVANDDPPTREQALRITGRYLSQEDATAYVDQSLGEISLLVRMRPEKWLSNDQSKS